MDAHEWLVCSVAVIMVAALLAVPVRAPFPGSPVQLLRRKAFSSRAAPRAAVAMTTKLSQVCFMCDNSHGAACRLSTVLHTNFKIGMIDSTNAWAPGRRMS